MKGNEDPGPAARSEHIAQRHRRLLSRTALVSGLTLISRLLGFVREMLAAAIFGDVSAVSDAFLTAWRVPNLFRRLLGEGALSTALQTALTEEDGSHGDAAGRRLFLRTIARTAWILIGITAVGMALVALLPDHMPGTGWAWLGSDPEPVRDLTVRLLPFVVFVCLAALAAGALNVRGHFAVPSIAPALQNVVWIACLVAVGLAYGWAQAAEGGRAEVLGRQWEMARWIAWGVLAGGALQLALHVPPLIQRGLLGRVTPEARALALAEPGAGAATSPGAVLRASLPLAFGAAVYQINVMIDGLMAEGLLADGGPSALYYANRIQQFPLALVAVAAISAVFPSLKALGHLGRKAELRRLHDDAQRGVAFLALPASVGLALLAHPIAAVLLQHGSYGHEGIERIASALLFLAAALPAAGAVGLCTRVYYALGDFRTPVRISVVLLIVNVGLNAYFVLGLGMDTAGLALATCLGTWAQLAWLAPGMRSRLGLAAAEPGGWSELGRVFLASMAGGAAALAAHKGVGMALGLVGAERATSITALAVALVAGVAGFFVAARSLRLAGWQELARRLGRGKGTPS